MSGKCRFNHAWLQMEKYMSCVKTDEDPGRAKCRLCGGKTIDISNTREAALTINEPCQRKQTERCYYRSFSNPIPPLKSTPFSSQLLYSSLSRNSTSIPPINQYTHTFNPILPQPQPQPQRRTHTLHTTSLSPPPAQPPPPNHSRFTHKTINST